MAILESLLQILCEGFKESEILIEAAFVSYLRLFSELRCTYLTTTAIYYNVTCRGPHRFSAKKATAFSDE